MQMYEYLNADWKLQSVVKLNDGNDTDDILEDTTQSITYKGYRYKYIKEKGWRTFVLKGQKKDFFCVSS